MAFPNTNLLDNFNRANSNPISGNWSNSGLGVSEAQMQLLSNQATGTGDPSGNWYLTTFSADQEVWATLVTPNTTDFDGQYLYTRVLNGGTSALRGYRTFLWRIGASFFMTMQRQDDPGVPAVNISSDIAVTYSNGDKFGMSSIGNTHTCYLFHGGAWSQIVQATDSNYNRAGFLAMGLEVNAGGTFDDFGGGGLVTSSDDPPIGFSGRGAGW